MKVLLLGASGYLGMNLADRLSVAGHEVICAVRPSSDISRLNRMRVCLVLDRAEEVELVFRRGNIDWVINGACVYKPNDTLYEDMFVANVFFPFRILNLAVKYGVKNYMTIGTSLPAEYNPYSFTKHLFSELGRYISEKERMNFAELKMEMFYGGVDEPMDRFINACKIKLLNDENIQLTQGYQKRDIVRIEDVVSIIEKLINSDYVYGYKELPVGSGESHSIREIVKYMKEIIGSDSKLIFGAISERRNEPDTLADTEWYKDIGYKLRYAYFDGLKEECCKREGNIK